MELTIGGTYRHYKKKTLYTLVGVGKHSETLEEMVIYQPQYESETAYWIRPKSMFLEEVEYEGKRVPRFELV